LQILAFVDEKCLPFGQCEPIVNDFCKFSSFFFSRAQMQGKVQQSTAVLSEHLNCPTRIREIQKNYVQQQTALSHRNETFSEHP
jgi:hypothetical protein